MLVNADLYVKDIPGTLVSALEPMSLMNANIIGVVHSRDQMISGRIAVNVTFNAEPDVIEKLKDVWTSRDIIVAKIGSVVKTYGRDYMIIGDVTALTMETMLNDAKKDISIVSSDVRMSYKSSSKNTTMISASVTSEEDVAKLDSFVSEYCSKKGLTFIRGVA